MSYSEYPEHGPEWEEDMALRRAHEHHMALLEEKYNADLNDFRRLFTGKLMMHGALEGENGWALFNTDNDAEEGNSNDGMKEVLLLSYPGPENGYPGTNIPILRIITNEPMRTGRYIFCISQDIAFDEEGDMYFTTDGTAMNDEGFDEKKELEPGIPAQDRLCEDITSLGLVFIFDNSKNRLAMSDFRPRPPFYVVQDPDNENNILSPFGFPTELVDKIDTLERARFLLSSVMDLQPEHVNSHRQA